MADVPSTRLALAATLAQTLVMNALFIGAMVLLADDEPFSGSPNDFVLVAGVHLLDAALVVGVGLSWLGGRSLRALGWGPVHDLARTVGLGLAGGLVCAGILVGVGAGYGGVEGVVEMVGGFRDMPVPERLLCLLIGVGAAFIEESVFRGTLQPWLTSRLGRPLGLLVMALVFSAYHLKFALVGFLVKASFGLVFGLLRERTGTLWAPALAHVGVWVVAGMS